MSKWNVTLKATIKVDDPQTLDQLIIARMYEDTTGIEVVDTGRDPLFNNEEFEVIEYPDDWLDFTEVIEWLCGIDRPNVPKFWEAPLVA